LGDGGGNETEPLISKVRPVPRVRPVWKLDGSNAKGASPLGCCGLASITGERGPALREFAIEGDEKPHWY
jgi:hypothetical protein